MPLFQLAHIKFEAFCVFFNTLWPYFSISYFLNTLSFFLLAIITSSCTGSKMLVTLLKYFDWVSQPKAFTHKRYSRMVLIVASVHKIYHFQFLHICCALSVRGTYLTPISLCRTIFPSLSLSICSSHWSPWVGPTGINSLPPGLSCFMRASGMG